MRRFAIMECCAMAKIPSCLRHEDGRATRPARTARDPHLVPAPAWQPVYHQLQAQVSATQPKGSDHCFTDDFFFFSIHVSCLCVLFVRHVLPSASRVESPLWWSRSTTLSAPKGDVGSSQQLCIKGELQKIDISCSDSRKTSQQEDDATRQPQSQESDAHTQAQDLNQKHRSYVENEHYFRGPTDSRKCAPERPRYKPFSNTCFSI